MRQNDALRGFTSVEASKDSFSLSALHDTHADYLLRMIERRVGNAADAQDILQETFLRMWKAYERDGSIKLPHALLYTIAVDEVHRYHKRKAATPDMLPLEALTNTPDEEVAILQGRPFLPERLATFPAEYDEVVRDLPDRQRDAHILTDLRGLTLREAEDVLGVSKDTVMRDRDSARLAITEYVD